MKTSNFLALLSVFLALPLLGCGSVQEQYVTADEDTYNAVWPAYQAYFEADAQWTEEDKKFKRDVGLTWKARIDAAKAANAKGDAK